MILNETELRSNNETAQSQQDITLCKILIPRDRLLSSSLAEKERERDS